MEAEIRRDRIAHILPQIRPFVRQTPVMDVAGADLGLGIERVVLKLELLQYTGSFKVRGAFTHLLNSEVPSAGVVAASGGNHGAAVAYAAMRLGIPATIFVPSVASPAKVAQIREYGAELVVSGDRYADALAESQTWAAQSGALQIHAYDHIETLLGQGTVGAELEAQVPELDTLFVAVGGGGLLGGIAAWYEGRVRVIGVEPVLAPTLTRALAAGHPVDAEAGGVAADSLAPKQVGGLMFPVAQRWVDRVITVPDDAIRSAQRLLWNRVRLVAEPGGITALAGLLSGMYTPEKGERVGVLVCGSNTNAVAFP